jgi:hypothetical protein
VSYSQIASEEPAIQQTNNNTADISGQLTMFLNEFKNIGERRDGCVDSETRTGE